MRNIQFSVLLSGFLRSKEREKENITDSKSRLNTCVYSLNASYSTKINNWLSVCLDAQKIHEKA